MKDAIRQITVGVTVAATIFVNILAVTLPLNGQNTADISNRYPVYFTPAGYVFSIWGLIYIGLVAYALFQARPSQADNPMQRKIGYLVAASGVANVVWLFLWHYNHILWTILPMAALLGLLIAIYLQLGTGRTKAPALETWAQRIPFSIYLGWITVAAVANATIAVYILQPNLLGINPRDWMLIILAVVLVISALMSLRHRDIAHALVLVWALIGIAIRQAPLSAESVVIASLATGALILIFLGYSIWRERMRSAA
jgi:translocator protein